MNDFTKEELIEIRACVGTIVDINAQSKDYYTPLSNKIQLMIDNFEKDRQVKDTLNYIVQKVREWRMEM